MKNNETKILACAIQKGGCGKSLTSLNLAYALAKKGYSVLLEDADPQGTSSLLLNVDISDTEIPGMQDAIDHTMASMKGYIDGERIDFDINEIEKCIIKPTFPKVKRSGNKYEVIEEPFGFNLLPARIELSNYDIALSRFDINGVPMGGWVIKQMNDKLAQLHIWDYIIIDILPGMNTLAYSAICSAYSGGVIMVINMDKSAITGGENMLRSVTEIQDIMWKQNKIHKGILGVVKNRYAPRLKVTHKIEENLYNYFGPAHIFETTIPNKACVDKAYSDKRIPAEYDKEFGEVFSKLADEVIEEIKIRDSETEPNFIRKFGKEYLEEQV